MSAENIIKQFAEKHDLIFGISNADEFEYFKEKPTLDIPFIKYSLDYRINPKKTLPSAKSIIALGLNYNKKVIFKDDNVLRGNISIGALGLDYHVILLNYLNQLKNLLMETITFKCAVFSDTGPLLDREVAMRCGLGWQGKNCSVINEKFGSYFFIGYMIIDIELECSRPYDHNFNLCGKCDKCIKACPGKALENYQCKWENCISYLTQQKDNFNYNKAHLMKNQIYGCDICQKVCPFNYEKPYEKFDFIEQSHPSLEFILNMGNKEFSKIFKPTAAGWRGKKIFQRNALIALGNSNNLKAYDLIKSKINDQREDIKQAANWALNKCKGDF